MLTIIVSKDGLGGFLFGLCPLGLVMWKYNEL
jgi:hypothetical protein